MGILDRIMSVIKHQDDEPTVSSHEFIWCNTSNEVTGQKHYIGAELVDDFLTFYLVDPKNKNMSAIKAYQIDDIFSKAIDKDWFNFKDTGDKYKILVFSPYGPGMQVFTDTFVIENTINKNPKILEITIPYTYLYTEEVRD